MHIADVSPRIVNPVVFGSSVRTGALLERLGERHEVRCLAQGRAGTPPGTTQITAGWSEERLTGFGGRFLTEAGIRAWPAAPIPAGAALRLAGRARLRDVLAWADVALVEFPWQFAACRRAAPPGLPIVLNSMNVEADKFASYARATDVGRIRAWPWLRAVAAIERAAVRDAALVFAVSPDDRRRFVERYDADPDRIVVIANGADVERHRPANPARRAHARRVLGLPERPTAAFVGSSAPPNRVALGWVRELARDCPDVTFVIAGDVCPPSREANVVALGVVEDAAPVFAAADASLCPIEHGGGTKIKLLESLAAGLPTVAFAEALRGTDAQPGEHVIVTEKDAGALSAAVQRVLGDPLLAARLGAAARRLAIERYSWDAIALRLHAALEGLAAGPAVAADMAAA